MKKIILLALSLLLCFQCASAEVITINTQNATLEELIAARDTIERKISAIEAEKTVSENNDIKNEEFILTGNGTQILKGFSVSSLTKLIANCENDTRITLYSKGDTITLGEYGESQKSYNYLFEKDYEFTQVMIETTGKWEFKFSEMKTMNSLKSCGSGSYISDCFTVVPPKIVTISLSCDSFRYASVYLMTIYKNGRIGMETCVDWGTSVYGTQQFDIIIKPEDNVVSYFWDVNCSNDVTWEICEK